MSFYDLMIDLETMGTMPDAAVVSIGAVFFDLQTCTLGPTFLRTIHLATAVREGGKIEAGTVLWWLGQSEEARNGIRFGGQDIRVVLPDFAAWVAEACRIEDVRPWGNSASFDCTKLWTAYERMGMKAPWYWSNERCFRTVRNMYPQVIYDPSQKGDTAHNALSDAVFQAEHLFRIKSRDQKARTHVL